VHTVVGSKVSKSTAWQRTRGEGDTQEKRSVSGGSRRFKNTGSPGEAGKKASRGGARTHNRGKPVTRHRGEPGHTSRYSILAIGYGYNLHLKLPRSGRAGRQRAVGSSSTANCAGRTTANFTERKTAARAGQLGRDGRSGHAWHDSWVGISMLTADQ
jgi:hypothetical protein